MKGILKLLELFIEDRFLIDFMGSGLVSVFYDAQGQYIFKNSKLANYLLPNESRLLEDKIDALIGGGSKLSLLFKSSFVTVKIGLGAEELHPQDVARIISERSLIIIENYPNDWKFITGIIDKYKSFGKRKEIYSLIKKSMDKQWLYYNHAGGSGMMSQLEGWVEGVYKDFYKHKVMLMFDSDKKHPTDFKDEYKNLFEYLKQREISLPPNTNDLKHEPNDLVVWHMLYKRAIENYVPISVIKKGLTQLSAQQKDNLEQLAATPDDMDFVVYYAPEGLGRMHYISFGKKKAKEIFPQMFVADFLPDELEARCEHHKVTLLNGEVVSEIEQILLKIAKII